MQIAYELSQKALAIDESHDGAHTLLAGYYKLSRQYDKALVEAERAMALNPNAADAPMIMGSSLTSYPRLKDRILTIMYSLETSFSSCLQHNLLPTQERLYSNTVTSYKCTLCAQNGLCDQLLAPKRPGTVVHCLFNNGIGC